MYHRKVTLVGGGGFIWTPQLVKDMLLTPSLQGTTYCLYDLNKQNSDLNKAYCQNLASKLGVKAQFQSTNKPHTAYHGADYVLIAISTGGFHAMAHDLAIPEHYGIYHTVGDTSGPGGWARLIRNFDPFVAIAHNINRYCPNAVVLNYTNPMTTLTDVLARLCNGPVVGLCHGLFANLEFIKDFYHLQTEQQIHVHYAGINHFFWITRARADGIDVLADLSLRLQRKSLTDLIRSGADPMAFKRSKAEVATELFRLTGVMPYLGDRHTCEFFPGYITNRTRLHRLGLVRTTIKERIAMRNKLQAKVQRAVNGPVPADQLKRSRETAADIIDAHSNARTFIDVGNLPNIGQIANLPRGMVVETAVRVDANGFTPLSFGDLPTIVHNFVRPWADVFITVVDACFKKDEKLALQALRMDPVCSHLTTDHVNQMGLRLLRAHSKYITAF